VSAAQPPHTWSGVAYRPRGRQRYRLLQTKLTTDNRVEQTAKQYWPIRRASKKYIKIKYKEELKAYCPEILQNVVNKNVSSLSQRLLC